MRDDKQIIFFDGVCNLCNGFVDFLMKRDKEELFLFAPLQGQTAKGKLSTEAVEKMRSVVLWNQGETHEKSNAALMILQQLGGLWWLMRVFWILPKIPRDFLYDLVAKNRYRIFGKRETCRLPTPEERARFLS